MKKIMMFLSAAMVLTLFPTSSYATEASIAPEKTLKSTLVTEVKGDKINFSPLTYDGKSTKLYSETSITKESAIKTYSKAYQYIVEDFTSRGINVDLDNEQVQDLIKTYFLIELDDKDLQNELRQFAAFMDFYENKAVNDQIINAVSNKTLSVDGDFNNLFPVNTHSTIQSSETTLEDNAAIITPLAYTPSTAATYAVNWWNKTNNTSYPYYAEYAGQSTTNNNLNDLPSGASGQSNPRRAWNDCTNFVSQALVAGGLSTKKSGIWFPHSNTDNWYYSDSKPSHTWGGAHNFYQHFSSRAGVASSSGLLQVGDALSIDFTGDGSIDHTIIITKTTGTASNQQYATYHTTDTNQTRALDYFYNYNPNVKVYGYEIDKIT
ncbi:amidase domain-containing protein [Paenibacillus agilis]|uniref:amidase domain-containing protein n=1 Tax=Paenibacillus agilis TaxID=3020863 RepID=UPI001649C796|nr:amidase domain-containing protein [Paenibacillus agilis]